MKAVIVCGSRKLKDWNEIEHALDSRLPDIVIHGDCEGADRIAGKWCEDSVSSKAVPMPAQWDRNGRGAGPLRNLEMAKVLNSLRTCGYEVEVLAFPLGVSTRTRGMITFATHFAFHVTVFE